MKPFLLILAVILAPIPLFAQRFVIGLRTGASQWISLATQNENIISTGSDWNSWNQSMFGRYESKKHFAIEFEAMHYSFNPTIAIYSTQDEPPGPYVQYNYQTHNNTMAYAISTQYRIGRGKLKNYIGAVFTYETVHDRISYDENYSVHGKITHQEWTSKNYQHYLGLVYYVSYPVYKGFSVHAQADLKVDPSVVFASEPFLRMSEYPNAKFSLNVGGSYSF